MDPFRNELDAAHAKIAQLEEENRQLKGDHYPPPVSDYALLHAKQRQRNLMMWTCLGILALIFGGVYVAVFWSARAAASPSPSVAPGSRAASTSP